eukprot:6412461-Prymnesium_polylepis.1
MLSSARHRAGRFDVGALSTARAFAPATAERVFVQRHSVEKCTKTPRPKTITNRRSAPPPCTDRKE